MSVTTSTENVEKVVRPPMNPVITNRRNSGGRPALAAKKTAATPTRDAPIRLDASVPSGTVGKTAFKPRLSVQRSNAPSPAPTKMERIEEINVRSLFESGFRNGRGIREPMP